MNTQLVNNRFRSHIGEKPIISALDEPIELLTIGLFLIPGEHVATEIVVAEKIASCVEWFVEFHVPQFVFVAVVGQRFDTPFERVVEFGGVEPCEDFATRVEEAAVKARRVKVLAVLEVLYCKCEVRLVYWFKHPYTLFRCWCLLDV